MSILIKTMTKLPEHCYECPCHDGESGYCQADKGHRYSDYRPFWCPLVEMKEESESDDIISRKATLNAISELNAISFYEAQEDSKECYYDIQKMIKNMPPVKADKTESEE